MDKKLPFQAYATTCLPDDRKGPAKDSPDRQPFNKKKNKVPHITEDILGNHVARLTFDRGTYVQICLISPQVLDFAMGGDGYAPWNEFTELPNVTRPNIQRYADPQHQRIMAKPLQFSPAGHHLVCRLQDVGYRHNKDCFGLMVICQEDDNDQWYCPEITNLLPPFTWSIIQDERLVMDYAISEGNEPDMVVGYNCGEIWITTLKKTSAATIAGGRRLLDMDLVEGPVTNMGFACHGTLLVTATLTGCIRVLDKCDSYKVTRTLQTLRPAVVSVSTENNLIAVCDERGSIQIWDVVTGTMGYETEIVDFGLVEGIFDMAMSPNGQYVVVMLPNPNPNPYRRGNYLWFYHLPSGNTYFSGVFRPWDYLDKLFCDNTFVRVPTTGAIGRYTLKWGALQEQSYECYMIYTESMYCVTPDDVLVAFIAIHNDKLRIVRYTRARNRYMGPITFTI
jgi:hypothetical protein